MSKLIGRRVKLVVSCNESLVKGLTGNISGVGATAIFPVTVKLDGMSSYVFAPEELRYLNNRKVVL